MNASSRSAPAEHELRIPVLGEGRFDSPLPLSTVYGDGVGNFVSDDERVMYDVIFRAGEQPSHAAFERAGARQRIFFDPAATRAAIVTCGGLCPGLNNVIRTLFFELSVNYGVQDVLGIRYGFEGLCPDNFVQEIHHQGGTVLGTSRGQQDISQIVDYLIRAEISLLFCVGGDGTQRGAHAIALEIAKRNLPISIVGIPKTIDNDIKFCWRTFGFLTAVEQAEEVIDRAHVEATSIVNGVGLVRVMGREAGFIAAAATIASGHVNFTFVPEVPFQLEGEDGLLAKLERRLDLREHAVIVVAEGAGQDLLSNHTEAYDASGNRKLGDIGVFLKDQITAHFRARKIPISIKYFDPSYHIRSCPANTADSLLCEQLARHAAHAAMAGKTDVLIGLWNNRYVLVPLEVAVAQKKHMSPESNWWMTVQAMTEQRRV
jgi:6-phosphofructokinase 1